MQPKNELQKKPVTISDDDMEKLIYNFRQIHDFLKNYSQLVESNNSRPLSTLEKEKNELEISLGVMQKNNENNQFEDAIEILKEKLVNIESHIKRQTFDWDSASRLAASDQECYLKVIKLLREKCYYKFLKEKGQVLRKYDIDDVVTTSEKQQEEQIQKFKAEKEEGPIPRRLSGILQNPFEPNTTDIPPPPGDESRNNLDTSP